MFDCQDRTDSSFPNTLLRSNPERSVYHLNIRYRIKDVSRHISKVLWQLNAIIPWHHYFHGIILNAMLSFPLCLPGIVFILRPLSLDPQFCSTIVYTRGHSCKLRVSTCGLTQPPSLLGQFTSLVRKQ